LTAPSPPGTAPETVPDRRRGGGLLSRLVVDIAPLRSRPAFRRLWIGQAVSFLLGELTYVALPYQVYQLTGSTLAVGAIALVELVPLLTLTFVGGAAADAVDRRTILLWTEVGMAASVGGLVVNAAVSDPQVWVCFVLAFFTASFASFGAGASRSLVPRLVPEEDFASATALTTLYSNVGAIAGPALAGVLIATIGLAGAYGVGLAGFVASLAAFWTLPRIAPAPDAARVGLASIVEGFRYLRKQRVLLGCFLIDSNAMVFGMPSALFPALAVHEFHAGPEVVGYLYAAPAAGALVASLLSGWIGHVRRQGVIVVVAATLWGLAIVAFGLVGALLPALLLLAAAGAADAVSAVARNTILLATTPDALRGRMSATYLAQVAGAPRLGNLEAGLVASLTNLRFSIVSGGVVCVVGCLLLAAAFPALVRYDAKEREP
jgi:MFS family permease